MCLLTGLFSTLCTENLSLFHQITAIYNKYCSISITASTLEPPRYCKGALDICLKHYSYNFFFQGSHKYFFFSSWDSSKIDFLPILSLNLPLSPKAPDSIRQTGKPLLHWMFLGRFIRIFRTCSIPIILIYTTHSQSPSHPSLLIKRITNVVSPIIHRYEFTSSLKFVNSKSTPIALWWLITDRHKAHQKTWVPSKGQTR